MAKETSVEALLESGAHFGHLTRRWNPKMRKFIYTERNGIHIIDLRKTKVLLDIASEAAHEAASQGKVVLFVGTKNQAKEAVQNAAKRCGAYYVSERWLGGMLTNFSTIRKSIKRLASIDKMEADGTFEKFTKKERLMLNRERERLRRVFGGIEEMTRIPGAIFVVDVKKEHIAIQEAKKRMPLSIRFSPPRLGLSLWFDPSLFSSGRRTLTEVNSLSTRNLRRNKINLIKKDFQTYRVKNSYPDNKLLYKNRSKIMCIMIFYAKYFAIACHLSLFRDVW